MKTGKLTTRILVAVTVLAVAAYFGVNLAIQLTDPYTLTAAYAFTGEKALTVSGYVVRDEEALPSGGALVYSSRAEGERVCAGGTVALAYNDQQSYEAAAQLRALNERMEQLRYVQNLAAGMSTSGRLDQEVTSAMVDFRADMSAGDLDAVGESGTALRIASLKRSYAYAGAGEAETAAAELQSQIDALTAAGASNATRITAPAAGLYSSLVDGYESVLSLASAGAMDPAAYRAIAPNAAQGGVGKIVYGFKWGFVTMVAPADLGELQAGDTVTIRFQKGLDRDMSMTLEYVSDEQDGRAVALFTSDKYLSLTTLLRQQNAQIIFQSYDGIRVPRSAVRISAVPVTDEDGNPVLYESGNPQTERVTGVFCLWGSSARFKPVEVLWQEEDYILVRPAPGASAGQTLRPGEQVITTAEELYDGKVIQ